MHVVWMENQSKEKLVGNFKSICSETNLMKRYIYVISSSNKSN